MLQDEQYEQGSWDEIYHPDPCRCSVCGAGYDGGAGEDCDDCGGKIVSVEPDPDPENDHASMVVVSLFEDDF